MKTYNFKFNNKSDNNSNSTLYFTSVYKTPQQNIHDTIVNNIIVKHPYLDPDYNVNKFNYSFAGLSKSKSIVNQLIDSINALSNHNYFEKDDYDFEFAGLPVKVYDTFIQVGYDLIPINASDAFFYGFTPKKKKIIIDIIIKVNSL